jgi:hypothetical protein
MPLKDDHRSDRLSAIEDVLLRLDELQVVLGTAVGPTLAAVRHALLEGIAARDRGDGAAAIVAVGRAMDALANLAGAMDPAEAALMRMVSETFRAALLRGDVAHARETADVMMQKSGAVERKKPS